MPGVPPDAPMTPQTSFSPLQGRRRPPPPVSPSREEVLYVGDAGSPTLQATSPSGDVRLTLRHYDPGDHLASPHLLLRMDLRIHPRDLHAIPSDGHCGYHTLAVLSHPHYPEPPSPTERATLHTQLLLRLQEQPFPALREAASAALHHPPPRLLPRLHWFHAEWLGHIPDLPPIGCLAQLEEPGTPTLSPWYYCTAITGSPTQLEHSLADLLQIADSGRLMLHAHSHFHPVTPPPFFSLAIRHCCTLLQQQLGGTFSSTVPPPPMLSALPRVHRYAATRSLPGGIQLGLCQSDLSPEAQWGVIALKTIMKGTCITEYGGPHRSQAWLDSPGQNLTYVWSDLDDHVRLARSGQKPVIIDANPAYTDSWGGRINDGFVQGANVEIRRDRHSDKVHVWALETITPGTELMVHYGPDYWQEHFFHCPESVQQAAAQCYALVVVGGRCFQTKELRKMRAQGQAHQSRGLWYLGPRGPFQAQVRSRSPSPQRRHACVPLPRPLPRPTSPMTSAPFAPPSQSAIGASPNPDTPVQPDLPARTSSASEDLCANPLPDPMDTPVPFLWLMDLYGSIIEHTVQASWGVSSLAEVARFLHDPANCNMGSLLPWASKYGSPARFNLHLAPSSRSQSPTAVSPLGILAADYGLKARSASGIRGDNVEDWPCLSDPSDLALLLSHISQLHALPQTGPEARDLLAKGLSDATLGEGLLLPQGTTLLSIGDPRLPYSLFEPPPHQLDGHANLLPLRLTGDPRLPRSRDHAWTDLIMIGTEPNLAALDPIRGLHPLTVLNPHRMCERIRWALHSLCQATLEAVAAPPPRLRRLTRCSAPCPPPTHGGCPRASSYLPTLPLSHAPLGAAGLPHDFPGKLCPYSPPGV